MVIFPLKYKEKINVTRSSGWTSATLSRLSVNLWSRFCVNLCFKNVKVKVHSEPLLCIPKVLCEPLLFDKIKVKALCEPLHWAFLAFGIIFLHFLLDYFLIRSSPLKFYRVLSMSFHYQGQIKIYSHLHLV